MPQARGRSVSPGPNELQPAADQSLGNSVGAIGWPAIPAGAPVQVLSAPGVERSGLSSGRSF
jgi:hypothetical protein